LTARAEKKRLKKDQWPADLATQINASSSHAKAGDSANPLIYERYSELRTFTTALHLDNWVQADTLLARADLQAAERIVVTVTTATKGNFCEALTFTPDPARLTAAKWAHDLAVYINQHSNYLKAGVKNTTSKHITPQENSTGNLIWMPRDCGLKVSWDLTRLKELGAIYLDRDVKVNEACKAFVLDDTTEDILREITFSAAEGRNGKYLAGKDLATRINSQTQLIVAGQKTADARPEPTSSNSANKLWGCARNVRAFTTLMSLRNWDKGERIGQRDLREDEQVVLIVRGGKTGRIFESLLFTPTPGRFSKTLWPKDFANLINARSRFVRGGEENTTLGLMEPMHKVDVNFFWTPKGSGLVVEYQVISGIPYDVPGMTREARELFDQYAEAKKCISVDAKTGQPTLQIPLVELFADDSFSNPLKLSLTCDGMFGVHIRTSGGAQAMAKSTWLESNKFILTLRDGRLVKVDQDMEAVNGGDFKLELIKTLKTVGLELVLSVTGFSIVYKDGVIETFEFSYVVIGSGMKSVVRITRFTLPSGRGFEFVYGRAGQLIQILNDTKPVLEVGWATGKDYLMMLNPGLSIFDPNYWKKERISCVELESILIFPGQQGEKRVCSFTKGSAAERRTRFEIDGLSVSGKSTYIVSQDESRRLTGLEVEQQHSFTEGSKTETDKLLYRETLLYTVDGKVDRHVISPGGGLDDLVHDYTYDGDLTRLTAYYRNAAPRTAFVRTYRLSDGQAYFEEYGSEAVPICKQRSHSLDKGRKCLVSHTTSWEGDVKADEASLTVDAIGNPVRRAENDKITYWTYYNNYQQFKVTETKVKVEDWSLFGCLFKGLDYINPVGGAFAIGGSGGMTWGTRIDTKVEMLPTSNDYAKKTFNLPVEIKHSGSDRPLSCDVESELVCRLVDGQEQAQRLSFFGYKKVNEQIRVQHKLVILQPDCTRVSVVAEQLAVATAAAQPFINSLKAQIGKSSGDARKTFEQTLADLTKSLDAQSKVNDEGFKLNAWKAASMVLETYEYHTDKALPGHGTVKSVETVLLDAEGKTVEASRRKTDFAYSEDAADASRLTITTTISRSGETDVVSSQTRSRNTGKLYENLDTEGIRTVYAYDPQGNLQSETTSQGGKTLRTTTHTLTRQLVSQYDSVEDGTTTRIERDALGRKQALWLKPWGASSFIETRRWKYDALGRTVSSVETDYGKDNKQVSQRQTTWTYDELNGRISTTHVLKDAAGKDLKKIIQVQTPGGRGERFTQGTFSIDRQFNADKGTLTEHYATSGSGGCRIERSLSREGLVKAVRYLKIDKSGKESEHDRIDYTYDVFAQLSSARPKLGAPSTYTYDRAGRLLSTSRDDVMLSNTYDPASLAAVASESHVSSGNTTSSLGKQTIDMLGRTTSQSVSGSTTGYSYTGASTSGSLKKPGTMPPKLRDYVGSVDKTTRTHTQKVGDQHSTLVFSTSGRLLSFTDLTKDTTTYTYDFFDRITASSNAQCVCTFTYADNGLLTSESIKAVKAGNLTMKVDYTYDELGQEIRRTFTCDGIDTLGVERTLLADGRLGKSTLKSMKTGKEIHADSYEYDSSLRLKKWTSSTRSRSTASPVCWETWSYDGVGNVTRRTDPVNQREDVFDYHVAKVGQMRQLSLLKDGQPMPVPRLPVAHDSNGNMIDDASHQLSYHDNGQVKSHWLPKDDPYTYSYDDEGRVRGGTVGSKTDTYHYRGDSVYALVISDTEKDSGFAKRTLVLRNDSRACLMQDAVTDDKTSRSFELRDANGTVFASVDLASKAITHFRYAPYGERIEGVKSENWLGFKGEPLNRQGFYHLGNGYRLYDPGLGRFLSRDSRSPFGVGGAACYAFCNGDPVNNA
ncbi:MAG TPA: nematicidal protein 2-like protein, partial [Pseudomonas sp.]|nr:nematicidal protein 2-like protein [Pseudomonas sp.]